LSFQTKVTTSFFSILPFPFVETLGLNLFHTAQCRKSRTYKKIHPIEGIITEVNFSSQIAGVGKFPSGKNIGSGAMIQYLHGVVDISYQELLMTNKGV